MQQESLFDIGKLIGNHLAGSLSAEEEAALTGWLGASPANRALLDQLSNGDYLKRELGVLRELPSKEAYERILEGAAMHSMPATPVTHHIHFLRTLWFRYAAILLLIAGTALYIYHVNTPYQEIAIQQPAKEKPTDILPGGNKAILTLSDGSRIVLDSAANGSLAEQGDTKIIKLDAGALAYNANGHTPTGETMYNTISTPRGGQYQIVLPDGSKVWLNAASSVRFPTTFHGKERIVNITGEAYLEVTADRSKPFLVEAGTSEIQVLGTSFNVNAYEDEPALKTSLVDGSVKIGHAILKPGQAYISGKTVSADIEQDLAWKNGAFAFDKTELPVLFRQMARWYDIEIVYPQKIPDGKISGKMGRNLNLSEAIRVLNSLGVNCHIEGRRLMILP